MSQSGLAPSLLLAMPQLLDPNFNRSVVLLCSHSEEGALGFIVNRPVGTTESKLLYFDPPVQARAPLTLWQGGPVSQERGWLLCRDLPEDDDRLEVSDGIYMSSSQGLLRRLLEGDPRECEPDRSRLLLGYAGWGPGQLDSELTESAWLTAPLDLTLIFSTPAEEIWERAIRGLGIEPSAISPAPGIH